MREQAATPSTAASEDIERHLRELESNRARWSRKPLLREIYLDLHRQMATHLSGLPGARVELGSGIADIREAIPDCIRTDLFRFPGIDLSANVYCLPFDDASVSDVLMLDVFHHLRYPGTALREVHRVLKPGGRLVLMEPGIGLLGRLVYGLFHSEPIGRASELTWLAPAGWSPADVDYYAAQGNATHCFTREQFAHQLKGWVLLVSQRLAALSYVASGGYAGPQLYPDSAYRLLRRLDGVLSRFPRLFATRLLVVMARDG